MCFEFKHIPTLSSYFSSSNLFCSGMSVNYLFCIAQHLLVSHTFSEKSLWREEINQGGGIKLN